MKRLVSIMSCMSILLYLYSCDDVLEEDITNDKVNILAPVNQSTVSGNTVQFRWEPLDGAEEYSLEVIEMINQQSVLDSLTSSTTVNISMNPGKYQWRVRAENFAYQTAYTFPSAFTIVSSDDLTNQTVFLSSPSIDFYTNTNSVLLTWQPIQTAQTYRVEVDKTLQGNTITAFQVSDLTTTNYTLDASVLDTDAIFTWKVKAINSSSETDFATRRIFLDTQIPNQPTLSTPTADEMTSSQVNFTWTISADAGQVASPQSSILEIATDLNFVNIIQTETVTNNALQQTLSSTGDFYWRVRIRDQAGNESAQSEIRKFTVQ